MIYYFPFIGEIAKPAEPVNGQMNGLRPPLTAAARPAFAAIKGSDWIRDEIEEIIKEENKYSDYEIASFLEMKKFEEKHL